MEKIFKSGIVFLLLIGISCKKDITNMKTETVNNTVSKEIIENRGEITPYFQDKELVEIVKVDNKFKISCAKKSNKVRLTNQSLYTEITEPIYYKIDKIEQASSGFKIYLKNEMFYYDVSLVDENLQINYWKNLSINDNTIDEDYSFYTIDEKKLQIANLEKEICEDNNEISSWVGKYHLELSSTHGDNNKEMIDKYDIVINSLKEIELTTAKSKINISGEFYDENTIQGDISKNNKNIKDLKTSISPFLTLTKDGGKFYISCPLITQGAGFSDTPFEIKKLKNKITN